MSEKILEIKDERLSFFTPAGEVKALNGVSFSMNQGDVLGIVGESGSGKSVTAYSIMGLTAYPGRLVGGTVWFNCRAEEILFDEEKRVKGLRTTAGVVDTRYIICNANPTMVYANLCPQDEPEPGVHHRQPDRRGHPAAHQKDQAGSLGPR